MSKGSQERADTRYVLRPRKNRRTLEVTRQVWLDPECKRAKRQARKKEVKDGRRKY